MENTMKFWIPKEDLETVNKLFRLDSSPHYTVVSVLELVPNSTVVQIEICAECSMHIWYLIKQVEHEQRFEKDIEEAVRKGREAAGLKF